MTGNFKVFEQRIGGFIQRRSKYCPDPFQRIQLLFSAGFNNGQDALSEQRRSGLKLGRILVDSGYVSEDRLLGFLSEQLGVPYIDLEEYEYDEQRLYLDDGHFMLRA